MPSRPTFTTPDPTTSTTAPTGRLRFAVLALAGVLLASAGTLTGTAGRVVAGSSKQDRDRAPAILLPVPGDRTQQAASASPAAGWLVATAPANWLARAESILAGPEPDPVPTIRLKPRPKPGPFSMNLFTKGDFVSQATAYWCVSASVQVMMNIIDDGKPNRSKRFQKRIHKQARRLDDDKDERWRIDRGVRRSALHGLGLTDWAGVLDKRGYGPYSVERARTRKMAIRKAAKAMRRTGRPVGLVVWRGAHAWVMSGFTATADPAYSKDFKVKNVFIQDVWYPRVSSIWGRSRPPNTPIPVAALSRDYLRYDRPGRRHPMRDGKFMLILPTLPKGTRVH